MNPLKNKGFDPDELEKLRSVLTSGNQSYFVNPESENSDEYVNFFFLGMFEGKEVIYDAALYTLRLHHASEVYELAEHEAAKRFAEFNGISYEEDENGNLMPLSSIDEEIGWFITEMIMEIEEEETVKVQEFLDMDTNHDYGIGLDVALHVDEITHEVIERFIQDFNEDTLELDNTFYSYQSEQEDA